MQERLRSWIHAGEELLKDKGVSFYISPGNDDEFHIDSVLNESSFVVNCEEKVIDIGGYEMATLAWTNPTPWQTPRECSEEELYGRVEKLLEGVSDMKKAIFNLHCPPYDCGLDAAPELSKELIAGTQMVPWVASRYANPSKPISHCSGCSAIYMKPEGLYPSAKLSVSILAANTVKESFEELLSTYKKMKSKGIFSPVVRLNLMFVNRRA